MVQVISGFPGVGKTYLISTRLGVQDSDSSTFSWLKPGTRHSDWPQNYITHIKGLINHPEVEYLLVSSHQEVRDALVKEGILFMLVYPDVSIKQEYIDRYIHRSNTDAFVELLRKHYKEWITALALQQGCEHRVLQTGQYLSDVIQER